MNLPELWSLFSSVACSKLNQNKKTKKRRDWAEPTRWQVFWITIKNWRSQNWLTCSEKVSCSHFGWCSRPRRTSDELGFVPLGSVTERQGDLRDESKARTIRLNSQAASERNFRLLKHDQHRAEEIQTRTVLGPFNACGTSEHLRLGQRT